VIRRRRSRSVRRDAAAGLPSMEVSIIAFSFQ
jgi:hypothetical protein